MPADNGEILSILAGGGPAPRIRGLSGRRGMKKLTRAANLTPDEFAEDSSTEENNFPGICLPKNTGCSRKGFGE